MPFPCGIDDEHLERKMSWELSSATFGLTGNSSEEVKVMGFRHLMHSGSNPDFTMSPLCNLGHIY